MVMVSALAGCGLFGGRSDAGVDSCTENPTVSFITMPSELRMKPGDRLSFFWELRSSRGTAMATVSLQGETLAGPAVSGNLDVTAPPVPGTYTLDIVRVDCPADVGRATLIVSPLTDLGPAPGTQPVPTGVAWAPDGSKVAVGGRGGVWVFSPTGAFLASKKVPHQGKVSVAYSPDGEFLAVGGDVEAPVWLLKASDLSPWATAGGARSAAFVFSADGRELYVQKETQVLSVDVATGRQRTVVPSMPAMTPAGDSVPRLHLAPFGALVLTMPGELRELSTGRRMVRWAQGAALDGVAMAPDGTVVLLSGPAGASLRYPFFPEALQGSGLSGPFFASSSRPNGEVALGGTGRVDVVRLAAGTMTGLGGAALTNSPGRVLDVAWSPDGSRLAVAANNRLHVLTRADLGL
jgi:WD40 repeat protein